MKELPRRAFLQALAALAAGGSALDALQSQENLSAALELIRAKRHVPCLAAMSLRGDRVVASGIAGVRSKSSPIVATIDDKFHLGSDTKAMTATLVAMFIEDHRLTWTTTVGEIFSGVVPNMHERWRAVRLEQLLTHRGGAPAELDANGLWSRLWQRRGTSKEQRIELVRGVVTQPPAPAGAYVYSNAGYAIAGAMVEQLTNESWEDLIRRRLFAPLGITSAGFGAPGTRDVIDQPRGHDAGGNPIEPSTNADNPPAIGPAGTVHMSLADWAKFISLHLRAHQSNPSRELRLLTPATFDRLHTPAAGAGPAYACGWIITERPWAKGSRSSDVGRALTHSGSNTMWYCTAWLAPERDIAAIVVCNQGGDSGATACDDAVGAALAPILRLADRHPPSRRRLV